MSGDPSGYSMPPFKAISSSTTKAVIVIANVFMLALAILLSSHISIFISFFRHFKPLTLNPKVQQSKNKNREK